MTFDNDKKRYLDALYKPDNSKKGTVDEAMKPLIDAINTLNDYYTTSSCSGRISLFVEADSGKKCDSEWHFVTHDATSLEELRPFLGELPNETTWFRMESAIIHVVARTEEGANKFLQTARDAGFKHSGLLSTTKRYMIECIDSERIDVPMAIDGELIVEKKFIDFLISKSNKKLVETRKKMEKLLKAVKKINEKL